jgi:hypothetical protein
MHYACSRCEMIYSHRSSAALCCPNEAEEIADDRVVYCWRCRGDGCASCLQRGIMLSRKTQMEERMKAMVEVKAGEAITFIAEG